MATMFTWFLKHNKFNNIRDDDDDNNNNNNNNDNNNYFISIALFHVRHAQLR